MIPYYFASLAQLTWQHPMTYMRHDFIRVYSGIIVFKKIIQ